MSWANGDGSGLRVVASELGRIGALICGENTNPLARFALLAQGEQVHISTYPPAFPFRRPGSKHNYDLRDAIRIRAAAHSFEGKVFTIVASGALDEETISVVAGGDTGKREVLRDTPKPVTIILNPNGEVIAGPSPTPEGVVVGEIDIAESIEYKQIHDVVGYYNRFDVFSFQLNQSPQRPIDVRSGGSAVAEGDAARDAAARESRQEEE
jgi:nitrilase/aliphatic nitrilase